MNNIPTKCSDINTEDILRFLANYQGKWATWGDSKWMPSVKYAMPKRTPDKLQIAKMRNLIKRGLSGGCDCGCRGDYEITDKGLELISVKRTVKYNGY